MLGDVCSSSASIRYGSDSRCSRCDAIASRWSSDFRSVSTAIQYFADSPSPSPAVIAKMPVRPSRSITQMPSGDDSTMSRYRSAHSMNPPRPVPSERRPPRRRSVDLYRPGDTERSVATVLQTEPHVLCSSPCAAQHIVVAVGHGQRGGVGPEVLSDISFTIAPHSFQFLTGPSGAGKTTLLRLILLSVRPSRGLVSVFGEEVSGISSEALTSLRRRMGVVFQDFRLLDHLTTYENVALPLRVQGRAETSYRAEVVELLRWVGLGERMHVLPPLLSGGEKQRAAIARALIARPELLLADEPTGNVDHDMGERLIRLFVELNRFGTTVMIATHDRALIESARAREMRLVDGRLIEMRVGL